MKKFAISIIGLILGMTVLTAQTGPVVTADGLMKDKEKVDKDIEHPKKKLKSATWEKRGNKYLQIAQFLSSDIYPGMPQTGVMGAETRIGKPKSTSMDGGTEVWVYERRTLYFEGGKLARWEVTKPLVDNAVDVAYESYLKADELDEKGKFKKKTTTKTSIQQLRQEIQNKAVKLNDDGKHKEAVNYLEKALVLGEYPKLDTDTLFDVAVITYYAGVFAQQGEDYETANKYYDICIEKGYMEGKPYKQKADILGKKGEKEKQIAILQKGFKKFPNSLDVTNGMIMYYVHSGESEQAIEQLKGAIKKEPSNHSYYHVLGSLYDRLMNDTTDKYSVDEKLAYFDKALAAYKKSIELKGDNADVHFNTGALYYNKGILLYKKRDSLPLNKESEKLAEELKEQGDEEFGNALPYFKKAHEIRPTDRATLQNIVVVCRKTQKYDELKSYQEKLDNLPADNGGGL